MAGAHQAGPYSPAKKSAKTCQDIVTQVCTGSPSDSTTRPLAGKMLTFGQSQAQLDMPLFLGRASSETDLPGSLDVLCKRCFHRTALSLMTDVEDGPCYITKATAFDACALIDDASMCQKCKQEGTPYNSCLRSLTARIRQAFALTVAPDLILICGCRTG